MATRPTIVEVTSDRRPGKRRLHDLDAARRKADYSGDFLAKAGQTDDVLSTTGVLRLTFYNPRLADECAERIDDLGIPNLDVNVIRPRFHLNLKGHRRPGPRKPSPDKRPHR